MVQGYIFTVSRELAVVISCPPLQPRKSAGEGLRGTYCPAGWLRCRHVTCCGWLGVGEGRGVLLLGERLLPSDDARPLSRLLPPCGSKTAPTLPEDIIDGGTVSGWRCVVVRFRFGVRLKGRLGMALAEDLSENRRPDGDCRASVCYLFPV